MVVNTYSLSNLEKLKDMLEATPETACPKACMSEERHKAASLMYANQINRTVHICRLRACAYGVKMAIPLMVRWPAWNPHLSGVLTTPLRATMACSLRVSLKSHL